VPVRNQLPSAKSAQTGRRQGISLSTHVQCGETTCGISDAAAIPAASTQGTGENQIVDCRTEASHQRADTSAERESRDPRGRRPVSPREGHEPTHSAPQLRHATQKLCALLSAFSTAAGDVASDLEDHAAQGRLEEARPLVEQLEAMARELLELTNALLLETLRHQAAAAGDRERTVGP
jgi:hypothetical protein